MMSTTDRETIANQIKATLESLLGRDFLTNRESKLYYFGVSNYSKEQYQLFRTYDILKYEDAIEIIYIIEKESSSREDIIRDLKDDTNINHPILYLCLFLKV